METTSTATAPAAPASIAAAAATATAAQAVRSLVCGLVAACGQKNGACRLVAKSVLQGPGAHDGSYETSQAMYITMARMLWCVRDFFFTFTPRYSEHEGLTCDFCEIRKRILIFVL